MFTIWPAQYSLWEEEQSGTRIKEFWARIAHCLQSSARNLSVIPPFFRLLIDDRMFTCKKIRNGSTYLSTHLSANDYYCEQEQVTGVWVGKGAERLGIADQFIEKDDAAFEALRLNQHPDDSGPLTPRKAENSIRFFDFQCSAQKSVSLMAVMMEDRRLCDAHDRATRKALAELERFAAIQTRQGHYKHRHTTGNLCAAAFRHDASRELDPQLHTHFVIANATWDAARQRWLGLKLGRTTLIHLYKGSLWNNAWSSFGYYTQLGSPRQDVELAQLLRALQLYKAFYDEIPGRVCQAVKEADALHQTFKSLHESAALRLDRVLSQLERNTTMASTIANEFREAKTVIAAATQKSTTDIAQTLEATLKKSLSSGLLTPFENFVNDIKDRCGKTATEAQQISLQLKQARRIHIGGYALAALALTLVLTAIIWINSSRHYAEREEQFIQQIDQNRLVLAELAREGTTLKTQRSFRDSSKLYLIIEHATAWTSDQDAVVEVK